MRQGGLGRQEPGAELRKLPEDHGERCDTALFPSLGQLVGQGVGRVMMSSRTDFNRAKCSGPDRIANPMGNDASTLQRRYTATMGVRLQRLYIR